MSLALPNPQRDDGNDSWTGEERDWYEGKNDKCEKGCMENKDYYLKSGSVKYYGFGADVKRFCAWYCYYIDNGNTGKK